MKTTTQVVPHQLWPADGSHLPKEARIHGIRMSRAVSHEDLDPRFAKYFLSGQRIEVTYKDGSKERCYVGRSTGWKPIWIALKLRNSIGGGGFLDNYTVSIKPINRWLNRNVTTVR